MGRRELLVSLVAVIMVAQKDATSKREDLSSCQLAKAWKIKAEGRHMSGNHQTRPADGAGCNGGGSFLAHSLLLTSCTARRPTTRIPSRDPLARSLCLTTSCVTQWNGRAPGIRLSGDTCWSTTVHGPRQTGGKMLQNGGRHPSFWQLAPQLAEHP